MISLAPAGPGDSPTTIAKREAICLEILAFQPVFRASAQTAKEHAHAYGEKLYRLRLESVNCWMAALRRIGEAKNCASRLIHKFCERSGTPLPPGMGRLTVSPPEPGSTGTRSTACQRVPRPGDYDYEEPTNLAAALEPEVIDPDEEEALAEYERQQDADQVDDDGDGDESRGTDAGGGIPASAFGQVAGGFGGAGASLVELPPRVPATPTPAPKGAVGAQLSLADVYEQADAVPTDMAAYLARPDLDLYEKAETVARIREMLKAVRA